MNLTDKLTEGFESLKKYILAFFTWLGLGIIMGLAGGVVGAGFSSLLSFVTNVRGSYPYIIFGLPLAGVVIALIYKLLKLDGTGTNGVFETVRGEKTVPKALAPAVFVTTAITHLFGGSAGREGAALQIGGSLASIIGKVLCVNEKNLHILTMCGMSALFSAVFGTPVGACVFAVEVASSGRLYTAALYPCMVSSVTAYGTALLLGIRPDHYEVGAVPAFSFELVWYTLIIGIATALVGILFCTAMHKTHHLMRGLFPNRMLRAAVGGVIVVLLTVIVGSGDYNGSGAHIIEGIFEGHPVVEYAFLLKIVFTAITMGSGFKGGEIVPTLFIGATLGATAAGYLGMSIPLGAAIGMSALFGGVTNCPLTATVLAFELFGADGAVYYLTAILVCYLLSGSHSLYSGQKVLFSRLDDSELT